MYIKIDIYKVIEDIEIKINGRYTSVPSLFSQIKVLPHSVIQSKSHGDDPEDWTTSLNLRNTCIQTRKVSPCYD